MNTITNEKTLGNAEKSQQSNWELDSNQLIQKWEVPNSPFTIIKAEDKFFLAMGKYRLSEPYETKEETEEDAKLMNWGRMMQVMQIMIENQETVKAAFAQHAAKQVTN